MKHVQQFDDFLNEGAFHVALFKARNEGLKEFEFKGKIYPVKEKKLDEGFEVHYSDGVRGMQKFNDKSKALSFAKEKIKKGSGLKDIAVYNASSGFHSTADEKYLIAWWGDGSYWDNVSKRDEDIKAKKINESKLNEDWGSSDQANMNRTIHKDMGNPTRFPSPFDDKFRNIVADAVDFWWDEWPEYRRDREGLIDHAIKAYYRAYFPKEYAGFTKMFNESNDLNEGVVSIKGGRILAHKVLNKLVDMDIIPVKKKTEDLVEAIASVLATTSMAESIEVNEGMVQIAGKNKPSGAKILATIIVDDLIKKDYMKPGADKVKTYLVDDVQDIIMNNTF